MRLQGKKIIVTGGSRGIGAEIVRELSSQGAHVAFTYSSNKSSAEAVLAELQGSGHWIGELNLSDEASVQAFFDLAVEKWGNIDGLVNNAGLTHDQLIMRMKAEDFDRVINANLRGTFLCSKAVVKPMLKAKKGSIVHITSVIGQTGNAGQSNYAASKAGIEALSKSLALELASRSIRSNCIAPGFIETEMTNQLTEVQRNSILAKVPLAKIGSGRDIALAAVYLLSDEASYVTGTTLNINGGLYTG